MRRWKAVDNAVADGVYGQPVDGFGAPRPSSLRSDDPRPPPAHSLLGQLSSRYAACELPTATWTISVPALAWPEVAHIAHNLDDDDVVFLFFFFWRRGTGSLC